MSDLTATRGATTYADAAQLAVAFARCAPGQSILFARGAVVDPASAAAQLVRSWVERGEASQHVGGRDEAGRMRHVVQKSVGRSASGRGRGSASLRSATVGGSSWAVRLQAAGIEGRTLRECLALAEHLAGAARRGETCPSLADLAEALNLRDRHRAGYLLKQLNRAQVIAMFSRPPHPRVIAFTGMKLATADPAGVMG